VGRTFPKDSVFSARDRQYRANLAAAVGREGGEEGGRTYLLKSSRFLGAGLAVQGQLGCSGGFTRALQTG